MLNGLKVLAACALLSVAACGGSDDPPPPIITTQILSNSALDGDIAVTPGGTVTVTQGMSTTVQSVFAGIDPVTGDEYRSFLQFPLTGSTGVPSNAVIHSATLDIYINSQQPSGSSLPIVVELVSLDPPTLFASDYDPAQQPALASITVNPPFNDTDVHTNVSIDVTPLMVKAQNLALSSFQVRILEDLNSPTVNALLEINDTTTSDRTSLAPVLTVTYF